MLGTPLLACLNHLLSGANWARSRLTPYTGFQARFDIPPFDLAFAVGSDGLLEPITTTTSPDVTIHLPANTLFLLSQGVDKAMAQARVAGNAEFATELSFVLRNLRWDVEEDLSRYVGDIAARRLVQGADHLIALNRQAAHRLAGNFAEYFAHDLPLLVAHAEYENFRTELDTLLKRLASNEVRLQDTLRTHD